MYHTVPHSAVLSFVCAVFEAHGFSPADAAAIADVILLADLYGIESHGVQRLLRYHRAIAETKTARVNGCDVTLKGADGKVSTAVWCANGYSYALLSDVPMATDILTDLIVEIA